MATGIFQAMVDKWRSPGVARSKVGDFSGGILAHRTMANFDSRGEGPPGRFYVGRLVVYDAQLLADWMEKRSKKPLK